MSGYVFGAGPYRPQNLLFLIAINPLEGIPESPKLVNLQLGMPPAGEILLKRNNTPVRKWTSTH